MLVACEITEGVDDASEQIESPNTIEDSPFVAPTLLAADDVPASHIARGKFLASVRMDMLTL